MVQKRELDVSRCMKLEGFKSIRDAKVSLWRLAQTLSTVRCCSLQTGPGQTSNKHHFPGPAQDWIWCAYNKCFDLRSFTKLKVWKHLWYVNKGPKSWTLENSKGISMLVLSILSSLRCSLRKNRKNSQSASFRMPLPQVHISCWINSFKFHSMHIGNDTRQHLKRQKGNGKKNKSTDCPPFGKKKRLLCY